eukprot:g13868.t1
MQYHDIQVYSSTHDKYFSSSPLLLDSLIYRFRLFGSFKHNYTDHMSRIVLTLIRCVDKITTPARLEAYDLFILNSLINSGHSDLEQRSFPTSLMHLLRHGSPLRSQLAEVTLTNYTIN